MALVPKYKYVNDVLYANTEFSGYITTDVNILISAIESSCTLCCVCGTTTRRLTISITSVKHKSVSICLQTCLNVVDAICYYVQSEMTSRWLDIITPDMIYYDLTVDQVKTLKINMKTEDKWIQAHCALATLLIPDLVKHITRLIFD